MHHVPSILRGRQLGAILAHRWHVVSQIRQQLRRGRARVVKGTILDAGAIDHHARARNVVFVNIVDED